MDTLRREAAPLSARLWTALDAAVVDSARHVLSARRVATLDGPHGFDHVGARLSMTPCETPKGSASVCLPGIALLSEIRADFVLPWASIDAFERGAPSLDADPAEDAAREVALAEDRLALLGDPVGDGFLRSQSAPRVEGAAWREPAAVLADLLAAVETLDRLGIPGPYEAIVPTSRFYDYLRSINELGYPHARHLAGIVAKVHRTRVLSGAGAVFSTRGGDFVLSVGGDLSVGYRSHDREGVHLFCLESVAPQVVTQDAVCLLDFGDEPEAVAKPRAAAPTKKGKKR